MFKTVGNILFSLIVIISLMTQVMLPHHHHEEDICFMKEHSDDFQHTEHSHAHEGECNHEDTHDHHSDESCCSINNMTFLNPQSKEEFDIDVTNLGFICVFLIKENSFLFAEENLKPVYQPPELAVYQPFFGTTPVLRGPPIC